MTETLLGNDLVINEDSGSSGSLNISGGTFQMRGNLSSSTIPLLSNHGAVTQTGGVSNFPGEVLGLGDLFVGGSASMTVGGGTASVFWNNTGRIRQNSVQLSGSGLLTQLRPATGLPAWSRYSPIQRPQSSSVPAHPGTLPTCISHWATVDRGMA